MKPKERPRRETQHKSFDDLADNSYVRLAQLIPDVLPFSAATYWRKCQLGLYPTPIKLSSRITAALVSEVRAMNAAYAAGMTEPEIMALVKRMLARRLELATE
jgi:predicted DNA-binding transcriptional regulator AlpA